MQHVLATGRLVFLFSSVLGKLMFFLLIERFFNWVAVVVMVVLSTVILPTVVALQ
ncbi:hypothetical protein GCM10009000_111350 [Halobacterium noricense]